MDLRALSILVFAGLGLIACDAAIHTGDKLDNQLEIEVATHPATEVANMASPMAATVPSLPAMAGPPRGGATAPAAHADIAAVNARPNPYQLQTQWAQPYDGDTRWGSVTAIQMSADGNTIFAANRCSANSCVGSDVQPIARLTKDGEVLSSFGQGLFAWPHGMEVDASNNVWVADARGPRPAELEQFPDAKNIGHTVRKFSPDGELLMTIGVPGEAGLPPTHLNEPADVLVAPNGNIFIAQGHAAQFVYGFGPDKNDVGNPNAFSYISVYSPDGTYIKSFGEWGYEDGQFRTPHALAMDSQGRLFVADRGNRRIQIFTQDGEHLESWYQFSRVSGMYIDKNDRLYAVDSESNERLNPGWSKGIRIGSARTGEVHYFVPPHFFNGEVGLGGAGAMGEGVTADTDGNLYIGELGPDNIRGISKFTRILQPIE